MSIHKILKFSIIIIVILFISNAHSTVLPPIMTRHPAPVVPIVTDSSLPKFNLQPPYYVRRGFINKSFTLECEATGQPRYRWTKNDMFFNITYVSLRVKQVPGQGSLIFMAPCDEDIGLYRCFADNDSGTAASNTALIRKVWIDPAEIFTSNVTTVQGLPYKMSCRRLEGWPKPEFIWLRNGYPAEGRKNTVDAEGDLSIASLDTYQYSRAYAKNIPEVYTCLARTTYISFPVTKLLMIAEPNPDLPYSYGTRLRRVQPVPQFVSRELETAVEGQSMKLYCIYGGKPVPEVKWYHNNEPTFGEPKFINLITFGKILHIQKVRPDNRGNYTCKVFYGSIEDAHAQKTILLTVNTIPVFKEEPKNVNVTQGERTVLRCSASSEPAPEISWYFNGRKLSNRRKTSYPRWSIRDETITIEELKFDDTGNYGCNATNSVGYVYKDVYVNVVSPPANLFLITVLITVCLVITATSVVIYIFITKTQKSTYQPPADNLQFEMVTSSIDPSNLFHFNRDRLSLLYMIGEGNFSHVYVADVVLEGKNGEIQQKVAVKTTLIDAPDSAHIELFREMRIMKRIGSHIHVIKMIGSCAEMKPGLLILELLRESLQQYLRKAWRDKYYRIPGDSNCVTSQLLLGFGYQIARGMEHVSSQGIVHRDLAARNIMLSSDLVCKIADFGLAREVNDDEIYVHRSNIPLPIRWMSPESLLKGKTTLKSDVWSFGVVLGELASLGATPFSGKRVEEVKQMVSGGQHVAVPKTCKPELYEIISQCFHLEPQQRPDFSICVESLATLLEKDADYIQLRDFPQDDYFIAEHTYEEIV